MCKKLSKIVFTILCCLIVVYQTNYAQTTNELLARAKVLIEKKDYEPAIKDLTEAIKAEANNSEAHATRAHAYLMLGKYEQTLIDASRAIELSPKFGWAYYLRGMAEMWKTKPDTQAAMADFTKVIVFDPKLASEGYRFRAGINNEFNKDYAAALIDANEAIKLNPNNANSFAQRGFANTQLENYEQARKDYRQAIKLGFVDSGAYTTLSFLEFKLKNYAQAAEDAQQALKIMPNNQEAKNNLAAILKAQAEVSKSVSNPQNNASLATQTNLGVINGRAKTLVKPAYPTAAVKSKASGAVNVNVTVDAQGNVITAEAVSGDSLLREASIAAARQAKFAPHLVNGKAVIISGVLVYNFIAEDAANAGNKAYFTDANKMFIDNYNESDQLISVGMDNLIKKEMKNFNLVARYPEATALFAGKELYDKGDYAGAVKVYTKVIEGGSALPGDFQLRAEAYLKLKDYANALKDINTSIEKSSKDVFTVQHALRGDIYTQLNDYPKAIADYRKALELDPKDEIIKKNLDAVLAKNQPTSAPKPMQNPVNTAKSPSKPLTYEDTKKLFEQYKSELKPLVIGFNRKITDFIALEKVQTNSSTPDTAVLCQELSQIGKTALNIGALNDKIINLWNESGKTKVSAATDLTVLELIVADDESNKLGKILDYAEKTFPATKNTIVTRLLTYKCK